MLEEHGGHAHGSPRDPGQNAERFPRTTDSDREPLVAENVSDRDFAPAGPNASWCADITDIPTREGWLDLAVVEDLFSR